MADQWPSPQGSWNVLVASPFSFYSIQVLSQWNGSFCLVSPLWKCTHTLRGVPQYPRWLLTDQVDAQGHTWWRISLSSAKTQAPPQSSPWGSTALQTQAEGFPVHTNSSTSCLGLACSFGVLVYIILVYIIFSLQSRVAAAGSGSEVHEFHHFCCLLWTRPLGFNDKKRWVLFHLSKDAALSKDASPSSSPWRSL